MGKEDDAKLRAFAEFMKDDFAREDGRLRAEEQKPEFKELANYLKYITERVFGENNEVSVKYGNHHVPILGTRTGILVRFKDYKKEHPGSDPKKDRPDMAIRPILGDHKYANTPFPGKIFNMDSKSYVIIGDIEELNTLASGIDGTNFRVAQGWAKQKESGGRGSLGGG